MNKTVRVGREGVKDIPALLVGRGQDSPEHDKGACARLSAEAPRDFLFDLHHAQVLFGLVIGEGNCGIGQEPQDGVLMGLQPQEQIMSDPSPHAPPAFPLAGLRPRGQRRLSVVEGQPLGEAVVIAGR